MKILLLILLFFHFGLFSQNRIFLTDIDDVDFPIIKGKIFITNSLGERLEDINTTTVKIFEDDIERNIINISCPPPPKEPLKLSSALVIDVSGSMGGGNILITKEVCKKYIEVLQNSNSECALSSFNSGFNLINDFTKNYNLVKNKIDELEAGGGTNYNAALNFPPALGGVSLANRGQYLKNVIMITDGSSSLEDPEGIIDFALNNGIIINIVSVNFALPVQLEEVAYQTGGVSINNVKNVNEFLDGMLAIYNNLQSFEPCDITWESNLKCENKPYKVKIKYKENDSLIHFYPLRPENLARVEINPRSISFIDKIINQTHTATFTIKAIRGDYTISNLKNSHTFFDVTPNNATIPEGETKEFTVSYTPTDSIFSYNRIDIENNWCDLMFYTAGGYKDVPPEGNNRLKLTHPDGGEIFLVGSDTIITWENVLPDDTVRLEYTYNNGRTWNLITNYASNFEYKWENIPYPTSDECLVRVSQAEEGYEEIDYDSIPYKNLEGAFGGTGDDLLQNIIEINKNQYLLLGTSNSNDNDINGNYGNKDVIVMNVDSDNIIWSKNYGGTNVDEAVDIIEIDDGYIIIANTNSSDFDLQNNNGGSDIWIFKIDLTGVILWSKTIEGNENDIAEDAIKVNDGILITGLTNSNIGEFNADKGKSDVFALKVDFEGNILWSETYGGSGSDIGKSIIELSGGNIMIVADSDSENGNKTENKGKEDIWVLMLDDSGILNFEFSYGGSGNDNVDNVTETSNGDFILVGNTFSNDGDVKNHYGNGDVWVVKFDVTGTIIWEKNYGGNLGDFGVKITENFYGDYLVGAFTNSEDLDIDKNNGNYDFWFFKIDNVGQLIWERSYGGTHVEELKNYIILDDDSYLLAGSARSDDFDVSDNNGLFDFWFVSISPDPPTLQNDVSNNLFSIVSTEVEAIDIDMGEVVVGTFKDSLISDFIKNIGLFETEIKEVNFKDGDNSEFSLVSSFPPFILDANSNSQAEFRFSPASIGPKQSTIEIITQSDTFTYNISGVGVDANLELVTELLDFGWVELGDEKIVENTVMIKNISNEVIEILDSKLEYPNEESFRIINGGGSFILDPNDEREMTIAFKPIYQGSITSNIKYYYDGAGSPMISTLLGSGIKGKIIPQIEDGYTNEVKNLELKYNDISLENLTDIIESYKINISYNGTMLAPVDRLIPKKFISQDRIELEIEGKITEITGDILKTIPMKVGLGNDTITEFRIEKMTLYDKEGDEFFYEFETEIDEFKLLGYCQEGGVRLINPENEAFMEITPNPVESILNLNINFIEIGYTKIELYSSTGKLLDTIFENDVEELTYKNIMLDMSKYKSGMYLLKLQSPTILITKKISVIR